jgi:4-hydroxy 2-oxovalerate aldolase
MVDVGRVISEDLKPAEESCVDMIRVASYVTDLDEAIQLTRDLDRKGYETTINLMAISRNNGDVIEEGLRRIEGESPSNTIYIVDSFGALYPNTVRGLIDRAREILTTKEIGFHGHNHQQLAFGNTLEGIQQGAGFVDGTVYGIGRAAGNCPLELIIGYLKKSRYNLTPILDLIAKEFIPLREKIEWGYIIPYALTGLMNEHPRTAMDLRNSDRREDYKAYYESLRDSAVEE